MGQQACHGTLRPGPTGRLPLVVRSVSHSLGVTRRTDSGDVSFFLAEASVVVDS